MPYCTLEYLEKRVAKNILVDLTDDKGTGDIDQEVLDEATADADSLIDSYLRRRYTLPFTTVPREVQRLARDITIYNLYCNRFDGKVPENIQKLNDAAMVVLKALSSGTAQSEIETTPAPAPTSTVLISNKRRPFFDRDMRDQL